MGCVREDMGHHAAVGADLDLVAGTQHRLLETPVLGDVADLRDEFGGDGDQPPAKLSIADR